MKDGGGGIENSTLPVQQLLELAFAVVVLTRQTSTIRLSSDFEPVASPPTPVFPEGYELSLRSTEL